VFVWLFGQTLYLSPLIFPSGHPVQVKGNCKLVGILLKGSHISYIQLYVMRDGLCVYSVVAKNIQMGFLFWCTCFFFIWKPLRWYCWLFDRLRAVIDRPPIGERELVPLSELQGFKLLPGAVCSVCIVPFCHVCSCACLFNILVRMMALYTNTWLTVRIAITFSKDMLKVAIMSLCATFYNIFHLLSKWMTLFSFILLFTWLLSTTLYLA